MRILVAPDKFAGTLSAVEAAAPVYAQSIRRRFLDLLTPEMGEQLVEIGETVLRAVAPEKAGTGAGLSATSGTSRGA